MKSGKVEARPRGTLARVGILSLLTFMIVSFAASPSFADDFKLYQPKPGTVGVTSESQELKHLDSAQLDAISKWTDADFSKIVDFKQEPIQFVEAVKQITITAMKDKPSLDATEKTLLQTKIMQPIFNARDAGKVSNARAEALWHLAKQVIDSSKESLQKADSVKSVFTNPDNQDTVNNLNVSSTPLKVDKSEVEKKAAEETAAKIKKLED